MKFSEFALLLEHTTLEQAKNIADELRDSIHNFCFSWEGNQFSVSASIGIAALTHDVRDVDVFVNIADCACYRAKEQGRDQVQIFKGDPGQLVEQAA